LKKKFVFLLSIISITFLLWIEQGLTVSYAVKTMAKAVFFLGIPLILFPMKRFSFLHFRRTDRKSLIIAIISGVAVMSTIIIAFATLRPFIDIDFLLAELRSIGVTSTVFPFVALYILLGNSILEEFFFRGLLPSSLSYSLSRLLIPSFLFAIYHISIFLTWFSLPILALAILGLWIGGIIFQLANERSGTILPSWIIHIFADLGVIIVGVYIFYFY